MATMNPGTESYHLDLHHLDSPTPTPPPPNGAQALSMALRLLVLALALRLLVLALALASAVEMLPSTDRATTGVAVAAGCSRFRAFAFLAGGNITVTILQAVAIILQGLLLSRPAPPAPDPELCTAVEPPPPPPSQLPEVLAVAMDVLTLALVYSATAAAYTTACDYSAQIDACPEFADQVAAAMALSLAAAIAATIVVLVNRVILPFNVLSPV